MRLLDGVVHRRGGFHGEVAGFAGIAGGARKVLPVGAGKDGKVEAGRAARTGKERRDGH